MNKSQLINQVADDLSMSKVEVKKVADMLFKRIEERLIAGEKVVLSGFGAFTVVNVSERVGRNPRTGEQVKIPPRRSVRFHSSMEIE